MDGNFSPIVTFIRIELENTKNEHVMLHKISKTKPNWHIKNPFTKNDIVDISEEWKFIRLLCMFLN